MASRPKCRVAELERQLLAAMHVEDAAEKRLQATPEGPDRIGLQMEVDAARALARELPEEQLNAIARSEHGVVLQMVQRYRAIDAGDTPLSPSREWPGLNRAERMVCYVMFYGLPRPRSLDQAARDYGVRAPRARRLAHSQPFIDYLAALSARRARDQKRSDALDALAASDADLL
jgi:hypothetical protein